MLFLMFDPPEGGMKLELEIESALVRMKPSPEGTSYQVCLVCETPDEDFELDLSYGSLKEAMYMYDGINLLACSNASYGSVAELEAAALSALEGGAP